MEINTIQSLPREQCTGCAACVNQCPANCISMQGDEEGFLYPVVNKSNCTRCGGCKLACPVLNPSAEANGKCLPDCYAAWSKNEEIRFHSTSGGIFTHLAQAVLAQDGFVSGARYRADHLVEHTLISTEADLEALRQSKYVQSEIGLVYREIKERLRQDSPVLFVGTPCQCAGLRAYLGKGYDNLYLCDFICRGVNSPQVYLTYLRDLENRYGSPVKQVWFKNKTYGWNRFCTKITFEDGQVYLADRETDPFMLGYIKSRLSCYMRPSCYQCRFKGVSRPVDITLGDFWGVELYGEVDTIDSGVSAVLLHTPKGKKLFNEITPELCFSKQKPHTIMLKNRCLIESTCSRQAQRTEFFVNYARKDTSFFQNIAKLAENHRSDIMKTAFKYRDTLNMTNLTMLITSKCTLKCKLCATYTSGHPHPQHYDYATLTTSVDRYFDSVHKEMGIMTISGGEPFMHPQLPEFLKYVSKYASRVKMIEIITNGTIVPSDRLIESMRCCPKFNLMIDNYGAHLSVNIDKLVKKLEENDIAYRIRNYTQEDAHFGGWIDVSDFSEKHRSEAEIEDIFQRCAYNNIHKNIDFIINGKVYMCYVNHDALQEVEELPEESVDLMDTKLTNEEIAAAIANLRNRRFLLACKNCNGYLTEDGVRQKPAEQMD